MEKVKAGAAAPAKSVINISGTFYYLCSVLDGLTRYIVNWDLQ